MKKIVSIILVLVTVLSMGTMAFAESTTVLTTTVPDATYTLNIPADMEIAYNTTSKQIGHITVTDSQYFAEGKNVEVTITYSAFKSETVTTTIPFELEYTSDGTNRIGEIPSGSSIVFDGKSNGTVNEKAIGYDEDHRLSLLRVSILSSDWGKALSGDYAATITFTSKIVVED